MIGGMRGGDEKWKDGWGGRWAENGRKTRTILFSRRIFGTVLVLVRVLFQFNLPPSSSHLVLPPLHVLLSLVMLVMLVIVMLVAA